MAELTDVPRPGATSRRAVMLLVVKLLLATVVMAATTTAFSLFVWTVLPYAAGWSPSVVLTGSMAPSIMPGDIVITAPTEASALKVGYVVRFRDPARPDRYLMHRIVGINDTGSLITRGDNNGNDDSTPVPPESVTGVARLRVPMIGLPAMWSRDGQYLELGLALAGVMVSARVLTGVRTLAADGPTGGAEPVRPAAGRHRRQAGGRRRSPGRGRRRRGTVHHHHHQRVIAA